MGKKKIICDTDILIELLNGNEEVKKHIERTGEENIAFSIITHAEIFAGSSKDDMKSLKSFFSNYTLYHLNEDSSKIFNGLIQSNHTRHSKWIPDALIAATALSNHLVLFTLNRKDFDFIPDLALYNP